MVGKYFKGKYSDSIIKVNKVQGNNVYGTILLSNSLNTWFISEQSSFKLIEITSNYTQTSKEEWDKLVTKTCSDIASYLMKTKFRVGDKVYKSKGDYTFDGEIVGVIQKRNGAVRVVAELDGRGLLHIFSENQLELKQTYEPEEFIEGLA